MFANAVAHIHSKVANPVVSLKTQYRHYRTFFYLLLVVYFSSKFAGANKNF